MKPSDKSPLIASPEYNKASLEAENRRFLQEQAEEQRRKVSPEVLEALQGLSPALVRQQLLRQAAVAVYDNQKEADQLAQNQNWPGDLGEFQALLAKYSPKLLVEALHYSSPTFDLHDVMSQKPLVVLERLLDMQMNSDYLARWL